MFEVAGLAATGCLLRRSHRETRTAELPAAPVFIVDGWFDMLTAASALPGADDDRQVDVECRQRH